jgi:hypothetical protein
MEYAVLICLTVTSMFTLLAVAFALGVWWASRPIDLLADDIDLGNLRDGLDRRPRRDAH